MAAFIQANLPIEAVAAVAEIRLHRAGPSSGLMRLAARDEAGFGSPYWAYPWAGGLALARHMLDQPGLVAGHRVLDLGAGGGLVAIAAARAGAARVSAAEIDPYARVALGLNAALNGAEITILAGDLTAGPPPPDVDLILVGDLFYEAALAVRVMAFLDRCLAAGVKVLVGDPWRTPLPVSRLSLIARYDVTDVGQVRGGGTVEAGVFRLEP